MHALRAFIRDHRRLAALLVALALLMKAGVPAGYMLAQPGKILTIAICADATGAAVTKQIVVPHDDHGKGEHARSDGTCPWSALGMASLAGTDAVLLAAALAFILALGFAPPRAATPRRVLHLRPPLRGPPASA